MSVASDTYVFFQWGYNTLYGTNTASQVAATAGTYTSTLDGYNPEKTVHYRVGVQNGAVVVYGTDQSFTVTPASAYHLVSVMAFAFALAAIVALFIVLYMIAQGGAALPLLITAAIAGLIAIIGITVFVSLVQGLW